MRSCIARCKENPVTRIPRLPRRPLRRSPRVRVPAAERIADAFARLNLPLRARLLARLLASVGSLALAVLGGGRFAKYLTQSTAEIHVTIDDAARTTRAQILEIVRYVEQRAPERLEGLVDELSRLGYA
jgi:hypothetical protein